MHVCMFGPPGSGKGTQSKKLAQDQGLKHICIGEILRTHVKIGTEIGKRVKDNIDTGKLVEIAIISLIVQEQVNELIDKNSGAVFDGFPRNLEQAKFLTEIFKQNGIVLDAVIFLDVPPDVVRDRIELRAELEGRNDDQSTERVSNRLSVYFEETVVLASFYKDKVPLHRIDGTKQPQEVYQKLKACLDID